MEFDNTFEVPLPPEQAWPVLMDIERIAPCMPGAQLTEVVDKTTYKGNIAVRLGPVALTFAGIVKFEDIDDANAAASFRLEPTATGSKVLVHTDLALSGAVAQYGRGVGMIQATAGQLIGQFADNLRKQLAQQTVPSSAEGATPANTMQAGAPPAKPAAAKPISGFSLMLRVIMQKIAALFGQRS